MAYSSCDGWVTLQGSKCKCNCFGAFSLRSKSSTLVFIFGDCNTRLLFTSRKKAISDLLSRYVCSYIKTNGLFQHQIGTAKYLDLIISFAIDF